jgi:hypothetical protein
MFETERQPWEREITVPLEIMSVFLNGSHHTALHSLLLMLLFRVPEDLSSIFIPNQCSLIISILEAFGPYALLPLSLGLIK